MTFYAVSESISRSNSSNKFPTSFEPPYDDILIEYENKFCTYDNATVFATTFNVNGKSPPEYFQDWLYFDTENLPDLVVIGLQEMDLALGTYVTDNTIREDQWLLTLKRNLPIEYKLVESVRLIGIFMVIYRNDKSKIPITGNVYSSFVATGFLKFGNKGGVGISLDLNSTSVCFINSHLAAGGELSKRNQDFREISQMKFLNGKGLYDHDIVIWLGDLNYRLDTLMGYDEVVKRIESGKSHELLQFDQLNRQQILKQAFHGFKEVLGVPFKPTYKFDAGTSRWDTSEKRRVPAWCDRILFWTKDKNVKISLHEYTSVEKITFSDHKPVKSVLKIGTRIINKKKKNALYEELLREGDKQANELLPQIELSSIEFSFGTVKYRSAVVKVLTIKNVGKVGTKFIFAHSHQSEDMPENWLTVTPKSSYIAIDDEIQVSLQVNVGDIEARSLSKSRMSYLKMNCILVLKLDQGRDYFIVVDAVYQKSCFGCDFVYLKNLKTRLPKDEEELMAPTVDMSDILFQGDPRVPIQIFWLCSAMRAAGVERINFEETFSEGIFHEIRDALDDGRPKDLLKNKNDKQWLSMLYSTLLMLMDSFKNPIIPKNIDLKRCVDDQSCLDLVSKFPSENLQFMDYLLDFLVDLTIFNSDFNNSVELLSDVLFQDKNPKNSNYRIKLTLYCINFRRQKKGLDCLSYKR